MPVGRRSLSLAGLCALGCAYVPVARAPVSGGAGLPPGAARVAEALLAAGEDEWLPAEPEPGPAAARGRVALKVAAGLGIPGSGEVGSVPGQSLPSYSDIWTPGYALDVAAEFGPPRRATPYARLSVAHLYGKVWQNPGDAYDVWRGGELSFVALSSGARFGGGGNWKPYAKVGLGYLLWPETVREDMLTGESTALPGESSGVALDAGVGEEARLLNVTAFVDLDLRRGPSPSGGAGAEDACPGFEAGGAPGIVTIAGGLRFSF